MIGRIAALMLIFIGATIAWELLGATLLVRTQSSDEAQRAQLGSLWGPPQAQSAPEFVAGGAARNLLPLEASAVTVDLALDQRRKGLLWYNTYRVDFSARYSVRNTVRARHVTFALRLPAEQGVYDDLRLDIDGRAAPFSVRDGVVLAPIAIAPTGSAVVAVTYRSRGVGQWRYQFGSGINSVRNFNLRMRTNFDAIDFPSDSLAPTEEVPRAGGWDLLWGYRHLVAGNGIGMVLPQRLQPGPLAQRLTFWAPLTLFFYFFVLFVITVLRRLDLHPMNFFFLAASFFSFHLLFAYTVDRIAIAAAFAVCSLVSMFLTVSYLRVVVGWRFAAVEAGLAQFFYLILFSLALFNEGYSGLAITIGSILTLFLVMQLTARVNWSERFAGYAPAPRTNAR